MMAIYNAADSTPDVGAVSQAPNVSSTLNGNLLPVQFSSVSKSIDPVTKEVKEIIVTVETLASIQPLRTRELAMKPEGERSWEWYKIYALPELVLKTGDMIQINGEGSFRVMGLKNWRARGYMYYEIVNGFTAPTGNA
jgi:hypothetical protein